MRAVLLAKATAATFVWLRLAIPVTQRLSRSSRCLACETTARGPWISSVRRLNIPAFADAQQAILAAGAVLPRSEAQCGSPLAALRVVGGVTDSGDQRGGDQWADPAQLLQALGYRVAAGKLFNLAIETRQARLKLLQVGPQIMQQASEVIGQTVLGIFQPAWDR